MLGIRSRALPLLVAAGLVASSGAAMADTRVFDRPGGIPGPHGIARIQVDNDGPQVVVRVRHNGARWSGSTRIELRVGGQTGKVWSVTGQHSSAPKPVFRLNGSTWACSKRSFSSRWSDSLTQIVVDRSCLAGAYSVQAKVVSASPGRTADRTTTSWLLQQSRPNVLMIMTDDMRQDDLRWMPLTRRWLADAGVTFDNSFSPHPLCCPARASTLSGLHTHNHRVYSHLEPWGFNAFDDSETLPVWLQRAGYRTWFLGKYLNGFGMQPEPGETEGDSLQYVPPGWSIFNASLDGGLPPDHPDNGGTHRYYDTTLTNNDDGFIPLEGQYQTTAYGRIASQRIAALAQSQSPFFGYVSFLAPHGGSPVEPGDPERVESSTGRTVRFATPARPGYVWGRFDAQIPDAPGAGWLDPDTTDRPEDFTQESPSDQERDAMRQVARQRAESLAVVDAEVDRMMRTLQASGELEETLVLFTSDNGYFLGEQNIRQGKVLPYEPSLRVPLLMRGPGIAPGQVRQDPFTTVDIAATLADAAKARTPVTDGRSMLPVARGRDRGWTAAILTATGPGSTVRETDESGIPLTPEDPGPRDLRYLLGIRTPYFLYTHRANQFEELFDMRVDPAQTRNLVDDPYYADVLAALRAELTKLRACDGPACQAAMAPILTATGSPPPAPAPLPEEPTPAP